MRLLGLLCASLLRGPWSDSFPCLKLKDPKSVGKSSQTKYCDTSLFPPPYCVSYTGNELFLLFILSNIKTIFFGLTLDSLANLVHGCKYHRLTAFGNSMKMLKVFFFILYSLGYRGHVICFLKAYRCLVSHGESLVRRHHREATEHADLVCCIVTLSFE